LLKEEMTKGNFMNSPNRIYNVDETGISLDGQAPWVIGKRRYGTGHQETKLKLQLLLV